MRIFPGLVLALSTGMLISAEFPAADLEFFEKRVRPLLAEYCYKCHQCQVEEIEGGIATGLSRGRDQGRRDGFGIGAGKTGGESPGGVDSLPE